MKVNLLRYTPDPEQITAAAAKICYSNANNIDNLLENLDENNVDKFLDKMNELPQHGTLKEHVYFTFAIEGVSRALSHQLVRHRIASFDQQSQRYCDDTNFDFVTPPSIAKNEEIKKIYEDFIISTQKMYQDLLGFGIPREDARFVFPNATTTRLIMTMNLRSLMHFFALRCCNRAQWEIRELANKMLKICKETAPKLFEKAGATCTQLGYCPEGNMSCGKAPILQELLTKETKHQIILPENIEYQKISYPKYNIIIPYYDDVDLFLNQKAYIDEKRIGKWFLGTITEVKMGYEPVEMSGKYCVFFESKSNHEEDFQLLIEIEDVIEKPKNIEKYIIKSY